MTPSGTQLGTDVRGPRALYFGDIYQDASSISHTVVFHTRLRFLGIPPNIFIIVIIIIMLVGCLESVKMVSGMCKYVKMSKSNKYR